ncbi:hypothetical protein PHMEG_000156 [Phytophthora megakarya]|uniref:Uncharacterized protein n=1 Tax=Phytophthora megakarya TaxID=4795 RepID=A0A225X4Z7_9STRA|nr:hypothetical protein PHMEG_000156 [Phytophthora megakarya]
MEAWLLTCSITGICTLIPTSSKHSIMPSISALISDAATNSDPIVDKGTHVCFLHSHATTTPSTMITPPVTDFLSFLSPA